MEVSSFAFFLVVTAGLLVFWLQVQKKKSLEQVSASESEAAPTEAEVSEESGYLGALATTKSQLFGRLQGLFERETQVTPWDEIEEILYTSDLGPKTVQTLMGRLQESLSRSEKKDFGVLSQNLKEEITAILREAQGSKSPALLEKSEDGPKVIMIVGVNGAGKTTSLGKLAAQLALGGAKVLVAAGDTFRAAASSQLRTWTERAQVEIFSPEGVKDPSAVAFDAFSKARAQGFSHLLLDTAGRLHTQVPLMEELKKVQRVLKKANSGAPHEVWIVLDANSGQNALVQARQFHEALGLTGAVLTKMDGTAKGGVAVGLAHDLKIPIRYLGLGEKIHDLREFSPTDYVEALFSDGV